MKIKCKIVLAFLILMFEANGAISQEILFQKYLWNEVGYSSYTMNIQSDYSNGILLVGRLHQPSNWPYPYIMKLNKSGEKEWLKLLYTDNYYIGDYSIYLKQNNDLTYTVTAGKSDNPDFLKMTYFYRYDLSNNGDSLNMIYRTSADSKYIKGTPYFFKNDDGAYIYSLRQTSNDQFQGIFFVKTDSIGNILWKKQLKDDSLTLKTITRPRKDFDNGFIFLSSIDNEIDSSFTTFFLIRTDEECNEIQRKSVNSDFRCVNNDIYPTKDSGYIILSIYGWINVLTKIDKNFEISWQMQLCGDTVTRVSSLVENDDGDFLCTGILQKLTKIGAYDTSSTKGWLIKIDRNGKKIWDLKLGKDGVNNQIRFIAKAGNNEYFVAGTREKSPVLYKIRDNSVTSAPWTEDAIELTYPNPVSDYLHIKTDTYAKIEIFNSLGISVLETEWKESIDVSCLPCGMYYIRINNKLCKFMKI